MTTLPEEAVKAYIKAFGNTPRTKDMALKNEQKVRHALTAALPFLSVQGAVNIDAIVQPLEDIHAPGGLCRWTDVATAIGEVRRALSALDPSAARELALEEALSETRTDLVILQGNVADAAKTDSRWEGMYERVGSWIKRIDDALSSPDHSSDARNMVQDHIADAGKLAGADRPSVKGTIPTAFGDSVCFSGIDHSALILVSVRGNSGLVPIKYLLPHQLYVHDVQKLSEQGEVLVCAVPVYDQQINVTSAIPSAQSEGAE